MIGADWSWRLLLFPSQKDSWVCCLGIPKNANLEMPAAGLRAPRFSGETAPFFHLDSKAIEDDWLWPCAAWGARQSVDFLFLTGLDVSPKCIGGESV